MQLGLHLCALFLQPHYLEVSCPDLLWKATVVLSVQVFTLEADASGSWHEAQLPSTSTLITHIVAPAATAWPIWLPRPSSKPFQSPKCRAAGLQQPATTQASEQHAAAQAQAVVPHQAAASSKQRGCGVRPAAAVCKQTAGGRGASILCLIEFAGACNFTPYICILHVCRMCARAVHTCACQGTCVQNVCIMCADWSASVRTQGPANACCEV